MGGNVSFTGAFTTNFTVTGNTSVTLPTSGTLLSEAAAFTTNGALYATGASGIASTLALTDGQIMIGKTGGVPIAANISGTANEIIVTNAANSITLSTPQAIGTGNSPTFAGLTLSNLTQQPGVVHNSGAGVLSSGPVALGSGGDVSGILLPANGGTGVANANTSTITLGGPIVTANSFTTSGNFALTLTTTAATNVTLPTTGTLLSSGGGLNVDGVLYASSATAIGSTLVGTAGQVLTSNGAGNAPTFQNSGATVTYAPSTTNNFAGNTNNFAINASNTVYYLQNTTGANVNLSGIAAATPGRLIVLVNNSAGVNASSITLTDKDNTSTDVNEFHLQGSTPIVMGIDGTATLIYDATGVNSTGATGAWRVISTY